MVRVVVVTNATLFDVAAEYLGDPTQWNRIAALNQIVDPWLSGLNTLQLPDTSDPSGGGIGYQ